MYDVVLLTLSDGHSAGGCAGDAGDGPPRHPRPRVPVLACADALTAAGARVETVTANSDTDIDAVLARLDGPSRPDGLTWPDPDSKTRLVVASAADGQVRAVLRRLVRRYAPPPRLRPADLPAGRTVPNLPPIGILPLDPTPGGPAQTGPAQTGTARTGPAQTGPAQADPGQADPGQAGRGQAGPGQSGPGQGGTGEGGPSQGRPGQSGHGRAQPGQHGSVQDGHGQDGHGQDGHGQDGHGQDGHGQDGHGQSGSGRDLVAQLGLARDPAAVAAAVLDGRSRRLDLLRTDAGSVTLDGALFGAVDEHGRAVRWHARIEVDDAVLTSGQDPLLACVVSNAGGYAELDGLPLVLDADPADGVVEVAVAVPVVRRRLWHRPRVQVQVRRARGRAASIRPFDGDLPYLDDGVAGRLSGRRSWWIEPGAWAVYAS